MNIKTQNPSLYYYLLECRDIIKSKSVNRDIIEKLTIPHINDMSKEDLFIIVEEATEIRENEIRKLE